MKLVTNADHFLNEQAELMYPCNRLSSNTSLQLSPYIKADRIRIENIAAFIILWAAAFGNPDKLATLKES